MGTTPRERARPYPCDELIAGPHEILFRGVDVECEPAHAFRWLCQLRVAPYSYDLLDNAGRRSPQTLTPGLERLEEGQRFMRIFRLAAFESDRSITLHSGRGAFAGVAVTYVAEPHPSGPHRTRLLAKLLLARRSGLAGAAYRHALAAGDLVMMRRQLLNLKRLAEGSVGELG